MKTSGPNLISKIPKTPIEKFACKLDKIFSDICEAECALMRLERAKPDRMDLPGVRRLLETAGLCINEINTMELGGWPHWATREPKYLRDECAKLSR